MEDRSVRLKLEVDSNLGRAGRDMETFGRQTTVAAEASDRLNRSLDTAIKQAYRRQLEVQTQGELERQRRAREAEERGQAGPGWRARAAMIGGGALAGMYMGQRLVGAGTNIATALGNPYLTSQQRGLAVAESLPIVGSTIESLHRFKEAIDGLPRALLEMRLGFERASAGLQLRTEAAQQRFGVEHEVWVASRRAAGLEEAFKEGPRPLRTDNTPGARLHNREARALNAAELQRTRARVDLETARSAQTDYDSRVRQLQRELDRAKARAAGQNAMQTEAGRQRIYDRGEWLAINDIIRHPQWNTPLRLSLAGLFGSGGGKVGVAQVAGTELQGSEAVLAKRAQLEKAITEARRNQLSIAEKEHAVREADINLQRTQLALIRNREQRTGSIEQQVGMMSAGERINAQATINRAKRFGLAGLTPQQRGLLAGLAPEYTRIEAQKLGAHNPLTDSIKQLEQLGPQTSQELRGQRLKLEQQVEVNVRVDEGKLASAIEKKLAAFSDRLIQLIDLRVQESERQLRIRQIAGQAAQAGGGA